MRKILPILILIFVLASVQAQIMHPCCVAVPEKCGDEIDNDLDGLVDENCDEICFDGIDNDEDGYIDENCEDICFNGLDDDGDGERDEHCIELCGNKIDDDLDGIIDDDCFKSTDEQSVFNAFCFIEELPTSEDFYVGYSSKENNGDSTVELLHYDNGKMEIVYTCENVKRWGYFLEDNTPTIYCNYKDSKDEKIKCSVWTKSKNVEFDCELSETFMWEKRGTVEWYNPNIPPGKSVFSVTQHKLEVKEDCYGDQDCYVDRQRILKRGYFNEPPETKAIQFPISGNGYFLTLYTLGIDEYDCDPKGCEQELIFNYPGGQKVLVKGKNLEIDFGITIPIKKDDYSSCFVDLCNDNIDNDRDGKVDEGCVEICYNNIDDDADGDIDEGCCPKYRKGPEFENTYCGCPVGTTMCANGLCAEKCASIRVNETECDGDLICEKGESCGCNDCINKKSICLESSVCGVKACICPEGTRVCDNGYCKVNCEDEKEICFDGIDNDKDELIDEGCGCPVGTTMCANGKCAEDCATQGGGFKRCVMDGICELEESCDCPDCLNQRNSCVETAVCGETGLCICPQDFVLCEDDICRKECKCPVETTLCFDGTCKKDCSKNGGYRGCIVQDGVCGQYETCNCPDCVGKNSVCKEGAVCENRLCKCPIGTFLCMDGSCRKYCPLEICNGVDDDGNGVIDEDCVCLGDKKKCSDGLCRINCEECEKDQTRCFDGVCRKNCPLPLIYFTYETHKSGFTEVVSILYPDGKKPFVNIPVTISDPNGTSLSLVSDKDGLVSFTPQKEGFYNLMVGRPPNEISVYFNVDAKEEVSIPAYPLKPVIQYFDELGLISYIILIILLLVIGYITLSHFDVGPSIEDERAQRRLDSIKVYLSRLFVIAPFILAILLKPSFGILLAIIEIFIILFYRFFINILRVLTGE